MLKFISIFGLIILCQVTTFPDLTPAKGPAWLPTVRLGDGPQPLAIQGSLSDQPPNPQKPPFYLFFVHAYGSFYDGKLILAESGGCPTILIRSSLPLKPNVEYILVGRDAGLPRPIFMVNSLLSATPKSDPASHDAQPKAAANRLPL